MNMNQKIRDAGNVLGSRDTDKLIASVVDYVAQSVKETFGPYGHNVLIEGVGNVTSTKDGWTVLQNITFKDTTMNAIKSMIANVAQSTVLLVGDGSTTSTIAANNLNKYMAPLKKEYSIRDLEDTLTNCVNKVIEKLRENAYDITDENLGESIRKIALVSTNWNTELSDMISDIYVKTHNPIIKIDESGTDKTYVEYINGFDLTGSLTAGGYYITNRDQNVCELNNPYIVIFDHNIQEKYFLPLSYLAEICKSTKRTVVLMAPGFDNGFITRYNATNHEYINQRKSILNMVLAKLPNYYTIDRECIDDFSILTSSKIVSMTDEDFNDFLDEITKTLTTQLDPSAEDYQQKIDERNQFIQMVIAYVNQSFGSCDTIILGEKSILIKGMSKANIPLIEERKESIQYEIDKKTREYDALAMLTDDIRMKRIRLGKLQCNMAVIKVGGYGPANIRAKKDALDDATRACEAAYRDGYTIGGSMATIIAITDMLKEIQPEGGYSSDNMTLEMKVYQNMLNAFSEVFVQLFANKYDKSTFENMHDKLTAIITKCVDDNVTYDIIHNDYDVDRNVINPVNTDIETLKACLRLVLICITSNQFIFKHYVTDNAPISLREVND